MMGDFDAELQIARDVWNERAIGADEGHIISRIQVALHERSLGYSRLLAAAKEMRDALATIAETPPNVFGDVDRVYRAYDNLNCLLAELAKGE